jgi:TonB family protein
MKPAVRLRFGAFALCAALSTSATAAELSKEDKAKAFHEAVEALQASGRAGAIIHPTWTERPDGEDVYRSYPASQRSRGLTGLVRIICMVGENGRLAPCEVETEEPEGKGFGEAALQLSRLFKMQRIDGDGQAVAGRLIKVPIAYRP